MKEIYSMTGYGRSEKESGRCRVTVELRSVNNRYLDINIRLPRQIGALEGKIRRTISDRVRRGKMDVFVNYEDLSASGVRVAYNSTVAKEYYQYMVQMSEELGIPNDIKVSDLAAMPEVFTMAEQSRNEEQIWEDVGAAVSEALDHFLAERQREGEFLRDDLLGKLEGLQADVDYITERSPELVESYRRRLLAKVQDVLGDASLDENRIAQEVTIYADRICVDEELVRLQSHITAMRDALHAGGALGRKLDFIAQEMNRESNTILSKSDDADVADRAIALKTCVEKIREQIQNIE